MTTAAVIYARISSDQLGDELGVTRQLEDCRRLAVDRGWTVDDEYIDNDISATNGKHRPGYRAMLDAIADRRVRRVICWHPDRLTRRPRELEDLVDLLESTRCKVHTVTAGEYDLSTPTGQMQARIVGAVAKQESAQKAERMRRRYRQDAEAGKPKIGGWRPFGFEADHVTIRPDEADVVRSISRRLLAGDTLRSITADLNAQGVRTVGGVALRPGNVRTFALSPRYAGLRAVERGSRVVADAVWPAIITRADHDRLRALLLDPARRTNRTARHYLLSGLLACGRCGANLVAHPKDGKRGYVCSSEHGGCGRLRIVAEPLEEVVAGMAAAYLSRPEIVAALMHNSHLSPDAEIGAELAAIDDRMAALARHWAAGDITEGEWSSARAALADRRSTLAREIRTVAPPKVLNDLARHPERIVADWPAFTFDRQRAVVTHLFDKVTIGPGRVPAAERIVDVDWHKPG